MNPILSLRTAITGIAALVLCSCAVAEKPDAEKEKSATKIEHVDAKAAAALLKKSDKVKVLDVRTPDEFKEGLIKGAELADFKGDDFEGALKKLDKSVPYLVHCRSGGRSTSALETLKKLGFQHIYHLDGGMNAWSEAGNPVEKGEKP